MKLRPVSDFVVVRPVKQQGAGSILVPEQFQEKPNLGEVLAVGPGKILNDGTKVEPQVKVGETVYFLQRKSIEAKELGDIVILKHDDIFGVVED